MGTIIIAIYCALDIINILCILIFLWPELATHITKDETNVLVHIRMITRPGYQIIFSVFHLESVLGKYQIIYCCYSNVFDKQCLALFRGGHG